MKKSTVVLHVAIVIYLLVVYTEGFSYRFWEDSFGKTISITTTLISFLFYILYLFSREWNNNYFSKILISLPLFVFISLVMKSFILSERFIDLFNLLHLGALTSFSIIQKFKVKEREIIIALTIFLLLTIAIQIYQQYFTSVYLFGISERGIESGERWGYNLRNGLMRFQVGCPLIAFLLTFKYWQNILEKRKIIYVFLFIVSLSSLYFYLTRQFIISVIITLLISASQFSGRGGKKYVFLMSFIFATFIVYFYDELLGFIIKSSREDSYSIDIRLECISFFFKQSFDDPLFFLLGHADSAVQITWKENYGFYASDIGVIGQLYVRGIIYVLLFFLTIKKVLFNYRDIVPLYIRLFFISILFLCLTYFPYMNACLSVLWVLVLSVLKMHLNDTKL